MANIWTDQRQNNENRGQLFSSNSKHFLSARKHSAKKQVFGELKNVIHNHGDATPLKGFITRSTVLQAPSKSSLCVDVLRKQQLKQNFAEAQKQLEKKLNPRPVEVASVPALKFSIAEDSPLDISDLPVNTCNDECSKSLEEIWGEMDTIDEDFLIKVINGGDPDSDSEEIDKDQFKLAIDYKFDELQTGQSPICTWNTADMDDSLPLFKFAMPEHPVDMPNDIPF